MCQEKRQAIEALASSDRTTSRLWDTFVAKHVPLFAISARSALLQHSNYNTGGHLLHTHALTIMFESKPTGAVDGFTIVNIEVVRLPVVRAMYSIIDRLDLFDEIVAWTPPNGRPFVGVAKVFLNFRTASNRFFQAQTDAVLDEEVSSTMEQRHNRHWQEDLRSVVEMNGRLFVGTNGGVVVQVPPPVVAPVP